MKRYTSFAVALALLVVSSAAFAAGPPTGDFKRLDKMEQTAYGASIGVKGYVQIGRSNGVEQFGIRLFMDRVDLRHREHYVIEAANDSGTFEIGVAEMFLGSADLRLVSTRDASEVFPLLGLTRVVVRDKTGVVAELVYPAPTAR